MDDNEILSSENEQGSGTPSFGGSAAKAGGKLVGRVIRDIIETGAGTEAINQVTTGGNDDDTGGDGGGFFKNVIDFGIGVAKGLNPFSSDND